MLARIAGAPAGTRGISLFLVPKIRVNADGSLGEPNDVVCTGIEEKLGIHGSATCSLTLGGKGQCIGTLLGEENKGMRVMFHMMNEARLGVGIQGFAMASAAFSFALNYARERKQGMDLLGRKLGMKQGKYFMALLAEMQKTVAAGKAIDLLKPMALKLEKAVNRLGETALTLGTTAMSSKVMTAFAQPLLEVTGDVIMGWMHLWRAIAAVPGLEKHAGSLDPAVRNEKAQTNKHAAFYEGKVRVAEFFIYTLLPAAMGKMNAINGTCDAAMEMPERSFG